MLDQFDLSAVESYYEQEERDDPPNRSGMMTKILVHGYWVGVVSLQRTQKRL